MKARTDVTNFVRPHGCAVDHRIEVKSQDFRDLTRQRHQSSAAIVQNRVSLLTSTHFVGKR